MSSTQAELADKVQRAVEKMFHLQGLARIETHYFMDGTSTETETHQQSVLESFGHIRQTLKYESYNLGHVDRWSISITQDYGSDPDLIPNIMGRPAAKSNYVFLSSSGKIQPLLEYICWWNGEKPIPGCDLRMEVSLEKPSYLPSLVLYDIFSEGGNELDLELDELDKKILAFYGFGEAEIAGLDGEWRRRFHDRDFWLDFVSANELWFEAPPGSTFVNIINEHLLNHTFA